MERGQELRVWQRRTQRQEEDGRGGAKEQSQRNRQEVRDYRDPDRQRHTKAHLRGEVTDKKRERQSAGAETETGRRLETSVSKCTMSSIHGSVNML